LRCFVTVVAFLASVLAAGAVEKEKPTEKEKPAENMQDVHMHFVKCFQPPLGAKASQVTFHFSLNRDGGIIGEPRIGWLKFQGSDKSRKLVETRFVAALKRCVPIPLSRNMARMAPGKVYFFRFRLEPGKTDGVETDIGPY